MQHRIITGLSLGLILLVTKANAAFTTYDDFSGTGGTPVDASKWSVISGATSATLNGSGGAVFDGSDAIRSVTSYPLGSTIRIEYSSLGRQAVVIGTDSQTNDGSFASHDAMFVRDDGGAPVYVDGVATGSYSTAPTIPDASSGTIDFVLGSTLQVIQNGTTLFSVSRPAGFDEAARIELVVYPNGAGGTMTIDRVLVDVPEPASLALIGLPLVGMLARRR